MSYGLTRLIPLVTKQTLIHSRNHLIHLLREMNLTFLDILKQFVLYFIDRMVRNLHSHIKKFRAFMYIVGHLLVHLVDHIMRQIHCLRGQTRQVRARRPPCRPSRR